MNSNIILIGPMKVGKSTVGKLLAERLNIQQYPLDTFRFKYYKEIGYSRQIEEEISKLSGFSGVYKYWKQFELHSVKRILQDFKSGIIDFGAGHSVYENSEQLEEIKQILKPYKNIVLLIPSADRNESIDILNKRLNSEDQKNLNQHFTTHNSNYELAKITIYTKGKSPEETCEDIIKKIR